MGKPLSKKRSREAQQVAAIRLKELGGTIPPGLLCGRLRNDDSGLKCRRVAGFGTEHNGVGPCKYHGGTTTFENVVAALMMGHGLAQALDITPWESLIGEVRRTAGAVAWLDLKIGSAENDDALVGEGVLVPWVKMWEAQRTHLAKVSKMALDANVDAALVMQTQIEGETVARVLMATLVRLGLTQDDMDKARNILRNELLKLESTAQGITMSESGDTLVGEIVVDE